MDSQQAAALTPSALGAEPRRGKDSLGVMGRSSLEHPLVKGCGSRNEETVQYRSRHFSPGTRLLLVTARLLRGAAKAARGVF